MNYDQLKFVLFRIMIAIVGLGFLGMSIFAFATGFPLMGALSLVPFGICLWQFIKFSKQ